MLLLPKIEALQLFFSWERRPGELGGVERGAGASGVGSLCVERMSCILHLGSGKRMLSLGTLTVRLADGFLLVCSPGMVRL